MAQEEDDTLHRKGLSSSSSLKLLRELPSIEEVMKRLKDALNVMELVSIVDLSVPRESEKSKISEFGKHHCKGLFSFDLVLPFLFLPISETLPKLVFRRVSFSLLPVAQACLEQRPRFASFPSLLPLESLPSIA